jgi:hypothetical protein
MKIKHTLGFLAIVIGLFACNNDDGYEATSADTYKEKVQSVEEIERSKPVKFLNAGGTYNKNIWGNKFKIHGTIKNTATVVTFKNAVVKVTCYSETNAVLNSENYTIEDVFPPNSEKTFELKIDNNKEVDAVRWKVIKATPN